MARVLVSGVSGPIGAALLPSLGERGWKVVRLVRRPATGQDQISWDPGRISEEAVSGFDACIHLAGETIVGRWTAQKKARIRDSRLLGTRKLAEALARTAKRPSVFLSASAVGFYGSRGDEVLREDSASGRDFLSEVCREWERATEPCREAGIRTANLRLGLVLSPLGGALPKMLAPFRMGVGGNIGRGQQWWSWVHVDDVVGAIHHIMKTESIEGPLNIVAPQPVRNAEFTQTLAKVLHRPAIFPVPAFAARLAFGEMADELLLASQRVEDAKLVLSGYHFQHSDLREALENILRGRVSGT